MEIASYKKKYFEKVFQRTQKNKCARDKTNNIKKT